MKPIVYFAVIIFCLIFLNLIKCQLWQPQDEISKKQELQNQELISAAKVQDLDKAQNLLNSGVIFDREYLDKAIIIAGKNNNLEIFKLLEERVSRKAHKQAFELLSIINQNDLANSEIPYDLL